MVQTAVAGLEFLGQAIDQFNQYQADRKLGTGLEPFAQNQQGDGTGNASPDMISPRSSASMLARAKEWLPYYQKANKDWGVPISLLMSTTQIESGFNPNATSYDKYGKPLAIGPMQFIASTGRQYGLMTPEDARDPAKSIDAAGHYLHDLYTRIKANNPNMPDNIIWQHALQTYSGNTPGYASQVMGASNQYSGFASSGGAPSEAGVAAGGGSPPSPSSPDTTDASGGPQASISRFPEAAGMVAGGDDTTTVQSADDQVAQVANLIAQGRTQHNLPPLGDAQIKQQAQGMISAQGYLPTLQRLQRAVGAVSGPEVAAVKAGGAAFKNRLFPSPAPDTPAPPTDPTAPAGFASVARQAAGGSTPAAGAAAASDTARVAALPPPVTRSFPGRPMPPQMPTRTPGQAAPPSETRETSRAARGLPPAGSADPTRHDPQKVTTALNGDDPQQGEKNHNGYYDYNSVWGKGFTMPQLIYNIMKANPGIDPAVLARAVELARPMLNAAAQENYHNTMEQIREETHAEDIASREKIAAGHDETRLETAQMNNDTKITVLSSLNAYRNATLDLRTREFAYRQFTTNQGLELRTRALYDREQTAANNLDIARKRLSLQVTDENLKQFKAALDQEKQANKEMHDAISDKIRTAGSQWISAETQQQMEEEEDARFKQKEQEAQDLEEKIKNFKANGGGNTTVTPWQGL